jgi:predicted nucleic acid-binding protein
VSVTLVDSCVLLDIMTEDARWMPWSADALAASAEAGELAIDPLIYAEVSVRFSRVEELEEALPPELFRRAPLPWEAGFLAGKCFLRYRRAGGARPTPLPDFYIGAHAAVCGWSLLTRDSGRFRRYLPRLRIIAP